METNTKLDVYPHRFKSDVDEATDAAEKDGIDQEKLDAEIEKIKKDL